MRVLACCWPWGKIGAACNEVLVSHGPRRRGVSRGSLSCTPLSGIGRQSPSSRCSTDLSWSLASSLSATSHSCHSAWSAAKAAASVRPRAFGASCSKLLGLTPKPPRVASQAEVEASIRILDSTNLENAQIGNAIPVASRRFLRPILQACWKTV